MALAASDITALAPISVSLKFGFVAVMYLFLLWIAKSSLRDLNSKQVASTSQLSDATAAHAASAALVARPNTGGEPRLQIAHGGGLNNGMAYDLLQGATLGRGENVDIQLEDTFASTEHARIFKQAGRYIVEDLDSTNGTYLNGQQLLGPQPLHHGDRIKIGEAEFVYLDD